MVRPTRLARALIFLIIGTLLTSFYYYNRTTSSLSENADPENAKDSNGNTKTPDLAPGVGPVIDTHRKATQVPFTFPPKIHQTAKKQTVSPASLSWYYANPGEEHIFYGDKEARLFVQQKADGEVVRLYNQLLDPVARADLFRYVVLKYEGGVYSDIDTTALCPMNAWIPPEFKESEINLVVGIEVDERGVTDPAEIERWGWAMNFQFVQWTVLARPEHPALSMAIDTVVKNVKALAETKDTTVSDLEMSNLEIIRTTGPGAFTTAVLKYLELSDPAPLRGLKQPKQIKDVLVMPVTSFAPNQRHSGSKSVKYLENIPEVLVMHGFQATRTWADDLKIWLLTAAARARGQ